MKKLFLSIALIIAGVAITLFIQSLLNNKDEQKENQDLIVENTAISSSKPKQDDKSIQKEIMVHETVAQLKEPTSNERKQGADLIKSNHDNNTKMRATSHNLTEIVEQTMEQRFIQEETDYEWKPEQENKIFNLLNDTILGEDAWTEKTECKSTLCKIEINYSSTAIALISKTIKLLSESEGDFSGTSYELTDIQGDNGYKQVVLFHIRKQ